MRQYFFYYFVSVQMLSKKEIKGSFLINLLHNLDSSWLISKTEIMTRYLAVQKKTQTNKT